MISRALNHWITLTRSLTLLNLSFKASSLFATKYLIKGHTKVNLGPVFRTSLHTIASLTSPHLE